MLRIDHYDLLKVSKLCKTTWNIYINDGFWKLKIECTYGSIKFDDKKPYKERWIQLVTSKNQLVPGSERYTKNIPTRDHPLSLCWYLCLRGQGSFDLCLEKASLGGYVKIVEKIWTMYYQNLKDPNGSRRLAIKCATRNGHLNIVDIVMGNITIIEDPNTRKRHEIKHILLVTAAKYGQVAIFKKYYSSRCRRPIYLRVAARNNHTKILEVMGPLSDEERVITAVAAAEGRHAKLVNDIFSKSISSYFDYRYHLIMVASCKNGNMELFDWSRIYAYDYNACLIHAAKNGHLSICLKLIELGATNQKEAVRFLKKGGYLMCKKE